MPRTTREYALRYAEQAINDLERCISRLIMLRELYGEGYENYQSFCDINAELVKTAKENLEIFKLNYM